MSEHNYSRRRVLRGIGTATMATIPAVSGCLGSGALNPSEPPASNSSEPPASTPRSTSDTTSEPEPTPESEMSDVDSDAWTEYGPKPYARFSPQPDEMGTSTNHLTCTLPAVAVQHSDAFGDAGRRFSTNWIKYPPGATTASTYFNIWTNSARCIGGAFDKEPVIDRFESFSFEELDAYRGFDLYAGTTSGIMLQVNAVTDGWFLMTFPSDIAEGKRMVRHLIDLCREDATPHYHSGEPYTDVVEYLPQGVFTRVYPDVSALNPRLSRERLETAGETLRFDGPHTPATGVIALRFRDDVDDPRRVWEESSEWLTSFLRLSLEASETEIRVPADRTLILEGAVDPEAVFSS